MQLRSNHQIIFETSVFLKIRISRLQKVEGCRDEVMLEIYRSDPNNPGLSVSDLECDLRFSSIFTNHLESNVATTSE